MVAFILEAIRVVCVNATLFQTKDNTRETNGGFSINFIEPTVTASHTDLLDKQQYIVSTINEQIEYHASLHEKHLSSKHWTHRLMKKKGDREYNELLENKFAKAKATLRQYGVTSASLASLEAILTDINTATNEIISKECVVSKSIVPKKDHSITNIYLNRGIFYTFMNNFSLLIIAYIFHSFLIYF